MSRAQWGRWAVMIVGFEATPKQPMFVNVASIHDTKKDASREAARLRRQHKKELTDGWTHTQISVHVCPFLSTSQPEEKP